MPPRAIEELHAEVFFERFDLQAHRGLRQEEFFGGLAKAELTRNRTKDDETKVVEARHAIIRPPRDCFAGEWASEPRIEPSGSANPSEPAVIAAARRMWPCSARWV